MPPYLIGKIKSFSWAFFLLFVVLGGCKTKVVQKNDSVILQCDTENSQDKLLTTTNDTLFCSGVDFLTDRYSHSGEKSVLSNKKNPYAMAVKIKGVKIDGHYRAEIWRYGNEGVGKLVVEGDTFWHGVDELDSDDEKGWKKLVVDFYVPPNSTANSFKVFFLNYTDQDVFVDDLTIEYLPSVFPQYDQEPLRIEIEDWDKIQQIRRQAFDDKMLITTKKSYVPAKVFFGEQVMTAKVRLKGDWLDHISGNKWSFRIKLDKGFSWKGMRTFNIQTPETRSFLNEWVAHKLAEKEDVLTTRYGLIPVQVNGKNLGIYAYEEHFEKQLVENKDRREGPIVKFSEDHMWRARKLKVDQYFASFEAAPIVPFKKNKTMKSPALKAQYEQAKNQLNAFRNCSEAAKEIFDVDKTAKFLAFTDLTKGQHGLIWHNLRFYFNPVLFKLEPVGYDLYSNDGIFYLKNRTLIGNFDTNKVNNSYSSFNSFYHLFADSIFTSRYVYYLEKFSDENYLKPFFDSLATELNSAEKLIQKEFDEYSYSRDFLYRQQAKLRKSLPQMKQKAAANFAAPLREVQPKYPTIDAPDLPMNLLPFYVHLYKKENNEFEIENYYPNDFKILGFLDDTKKVVYFEPPCEIKKYHQEPTTSQLVIKEGYGKKKIKLVVEKNEVIDTLKFSFSLGQKPQPIALRCPQPFIPQWMHKKGNKISVKKGSYRAKKSIVIPAGFELWVEAGVRIQMLNGASFWSASPVFFEGTEKNPIRVFSSDGKAAGFTVIQAPIKSKLEHVVFSKLNTFKKKAWTLTGAVTFYESDVEVLGCKFVKNTCEDALNIVRSNFEVNNCSFDDIYSDAFDADFCVGNLENTSFDHIGNDAIDFSGSTIDIRSCVVLSAHDKGISGGENSQLSVQDCQLSNCNIAIASKDNSSVTISDLKIDSCNYGLVVFQKKPEYGKAEIVAKNIAISNTKNKTLVEKRSKIILEGVPIVGDQEKVADMFY